MQNQQQQPNVNPPNPDARAEPQATFEVTLPDDTDVSEIQIDVAQLNDINFGF